MTSFTVLPASNDAIMDVADVSDSTKEISKTIVKLNDIMHWFK